MGKHPSPAPADAPPAALLWASRPRVLPISASESLLLCRHRSTPSAPERRTLTTSLPADSSSARQSSPRWPHPPPLRSLRIFPAFNLQQLFFPIASYNLK